MIFLTSLRNIDVHRLYHQHHRQNSEALVVFQRQVRHQLRVQEKRSISQRYCTNCFQLIGIFLSENQLIINEMGGNQFVGS